MITFKIQKYKQMKKLKFMLMALALMLPLGLFAQQKNLPLIDEIADVEDSNGNNVIGVFAHNKDGKTMLYLNVCNLGIGDDVVQLLFDPVFKLYIPLGETFTEAMETLTEMQKLFKAAPGTVTEYTGNFAPLAPTEKLETVKVTSRKLLVSRNLEFSLEREGYIRATSVSKSDFGNLMRNLKLNKKLYTKRYQ